MIGDKQQPPTCTLYVVDDVESPYRTVLQHLLKEGHLSLEFFNTASAALRRARIDVDGVWFVSIDQPDLSGPQVIEMLVSFTGNKMIVAVGSVYSPQDETAALSSGACQYFVKPLVVERCRAVIDTYLSLYTPLIEDEEFFLELRALQR
jgi:DNA-binding NtrC family response regulator